MVRVETVVGLMKAGMGTLPDAEVARKVKLTRQRVSGVRQLLDLPKVSRTRYRDIQRVDAMRKSGARTLKDAAEAIGASMLVARQAIKRTGVDLGLRGQRGPRPRTRGVRITTTRRVITAANKSKNLSDLARRLGMASSNLHTFLDRHGLSEDVRKILGTRPRRKYKSDRTLEEVMKAVKDAKSYRQVAARLHMQPSYLRPVLGRLGIMDEVDKIMDKNLIPDDMHLPPELAK